MKFDPLKHHRRSVRLEGYDYSSPGVYFITMCSYNRMLIFQNNEIKKILKTEWMNLPERFINISLDEFIIMPNHFHGIIIIGNPNHDKRKNVPHIVQAYKSLTTKTYSKSPIASTLEMPAKLWQRNYYEHIIRNGTEMNIIRNYIRDNPENWRDDPENPKNYPA